MTTLGRTLARLAPSTTPHGADDGQLISVALAELEVGTNVRTNLVGLEELADSIREQGVLSPIRVRARDDGQPGWLVVWGQRRTLAARLAGLVEIPAIVTLQEYTRAELAIEQLVENLQRQDLNPLEAALALRGVLDADSDLTHQVLATKLGRSKAWLSNLVRLLSTCAEVQAALGAGEITASQAEACVGLDQVDQHVILRRAKKGNTTTKELERHASDLRRTAPDRRERAALEARRVTQVLELLAAALVDGGLLERVYVEGPGEMCQAVVAGGYTLHRSERHGDVEQLGPDEEPCCPGVLVKAWADPILARACWNPAHMKARKSKRPESAWEKENREKKARLTAERKVLLEKAGPALTESLRSTQGDRILLLLIARSDTDTAGDLVKRYGPKPDEVDEENLTEEEIEELERKVDATGHPVIRAVVDGIPDRKVTDELIAAVTRRLAGDDMAYWSGWRARVSELLGIVP